MNNTDLIGHELTEIGSGPSNTNVKRRSWYSDTITVCIENEQNLTHTGLHISNPSVQLCPAIVLSTEEQVCHAVKHIYSKLASTAKEVDHGIPDIIFSMIATGNTCSNEFSQKLQNGLSQVINKCSSWFIICGEQSDPLSVITSLSIQEVLRNADKIEETLTIIIQNTDVIHARSSSYACNLDKIERKQPKVMIESRFNTLYILLSSLSSLTTAKTIEKFRAYTSVKLATPPPAIFIGVPDERSSHLQTPVGMPAIILHHQQRHDKIPIGIVLFCGATLDSLEELEIYANHGVAALVIHDSCELCAIFHTCWLMYHSCSFNFEQFDIWITNELHSLVSGNAYNENQIKKAKNIINRLLSQTSGDCSLVRIWDQNELVYYQ